MLGVCLGAQIIAEVLGGRVRRDDEPEIGWFPVEARRRVRRGAAVRRLAERGRRGHWHGDTFELPLAMEPVLSSEACANQAFVFDGRVVGLQFHLEWDDEALAALIDAVRPTISRTAARTS